MTLTTRDLTQTKQWLTQVQRSDISDIIAASFANIAPEQYLAKYFDSDEPFERKLRLYYVDNKLVGYCLLTFSHELDITVIGASAAFLPHYRNGGNTFVFSIVHSVLCWLKKPWRKHYYADTMLSPAMYRAIAKKTAIIWPHFAHQAPIGIFEQFNSGGEVSGANMLRCLVSVNRVSNYSQQELETLKNSDKAEIKYYCQVNPEFHKGKALFVIIPVHLTQVLKTLWKNLRN
ncbi:hypothetical protein [Pseudoalteromonas byunsanensis]|uniref:N-acetyltransferase domain-containing protein n=1 Tax=Pseudoalteromonas byunsanensis TaxID=327939 RepID=A0A1S1N3I4_9GAMM|nr:hypothetical protein [Pseudoalteromonas byunsanensis]OHU94550.1 hypothetical protein BIW53_15935 [Pseudoalteromonas byunsanensis]